MKNFKVDQLEVEVYPSQPELARAVAKEANDYLRQLLDRQKHVRIILATGNSQIMFLKELIALGNINWGQITLFHMDEYLGLSDQHKASFRRYMRERVEQQIKPACFHYIKGDALEPIAECERYSDLLNEQPIDLCCMGVGENGHIAFNDPPVAHFEDPLDVKIVMLDLECKQQQVNEGHFPDLDAVPGYALTLTIPMLCSAKKILCIAPEKRKARAVANALEGPLSTACPASILRKQKHAKLFLDFDSMSSLSASRQQ